MKKFFAVMLSFALIFATIAIPSPAWAEGEVIGSGTLQGGVRWGVYSLTDDGYTLTLSGTGNLPNDPSSRPWDSYKEKIYRVIIAEGVKSIGDDFFEAHTGIQTVTIANSLTRIGNYAFSGCTGLREVELSTASKLTYLGVGAFQNCSALTSIYVPNGVTDLGFRAFYYCNSLQKAYIGDSVTCIYYGTFEHCVNLTDVTIPSSAATIWRSAFSGCNNLKNAIYYGRNLHWNAINWIGGETELDSATRYDVQISDAEDIEEYVPPSVTVKQGNIVLTEDVDYIVEFDGNMAQAGSTGKVTVSFMGDYSELMSVTHKYEVLTEHSWGNWYHVDGTDQHARNCSGCGMTETEDCDYEEVMSYYEGGMMHRDYKCWVCGHEKVVVEPLVTRIYGDNRYETALMISEVYMELSGISQLDNIVVATGMEFPDALSGSYLSIAKKAPIILVNHQERFQNAALNYINTKVKPGGNVYLLGGTGVISEDFENAVKGSGFNVIRCAGAGRYETNIEILEQVGVGSELLVCSGRDFPDAATASSTGKAILLVNGSHLTEEQKTFLESIGPKDIYIIGGIGVVSPELSEELAAYDNDGYAWRVSGSDRAVTAMFVAQQFFPEEVSRVVFASGANFPDCIAGGLLANKLKAPIIYAGDARTYTDNARAYYIGSGASGAYALGGPAVVSDYFLKIALGFS